MPLRRYRDIADVPPPDAVDVGDPALLDRVASLSAFARGTAGPLFPPGLTRFTSVEEAGSAREMAILARMRGIRTGRVAGRSPSTMDAASSAPSASAGSSPDTAATGPAGSRRTR